MNNSFTITFKNGDFTKMESYLIAINDICKSHNAYVMYESDGKYTLIGHVISNDKLRTAQIINSIKLLT